MPSTDATLAWALKVDIETLGAHLEAYANLLPVINTLRLSNRFGKGPKAIVAKLPAELVNNIEAHMIFTERTKLKAEWNEDYRCYRMYCDPHEHLTKEQFDKCLEEAEAEAENAEDSDSLDEMLDPFERVNMQLRDRFEEWGDTHFERMVSWQLRVGIPSGDKRGIFSDHEQMIKEHFGLDTWISHQRLEDGLEENFWYESEIPAHDTIAFLMLPGARRVHMSPILTEREVNDKEIHVESGYGMPVNIPGPISDSERARFKRMMDVLDLKPYVEWHKFKMDLFAEEVDIRALKDDYYKKITRKSREANKAAELEPKLTMLIRNIVRSDEFE